MLSLPIEEIVATAPLSAENPPQAASLLGHSRQGRPIHGYRLGTGPFKIGLIAGSHADEPVGPELLRRLAAYLLAQPAGDELRIAASWLLVPHVNPDGEAANRAWTERRVELTDHRGFPDEGYDLAAYLRRVQRELPGDDIEWGYPDLEEEEVAEALARPSSEDEPELQALRPENLAVARFLASAGALDLFASLHGMAFARGPWFLLEPDWQDRTGPLRERLTRRVEEMGYGLHDVDRGGEKGFKRIAPGFSTRPDSRAMAAHFIGRGEAETAALFQPSSMELARALGGDPLTLVSEMPLFVVEPGEEPRETTGSAEIPTRLRLHDTQTLPIPRAVREASSSPPLADDPAPSPDGSEGRKRFFAWASRRLDELSPDEFRADAARAGLKPMPIRDQMRLQLAFLEAGLDAVAADRRPDETGDD